MDLALKKNGPVTVATVASQHSSWYEHLGIGCSYRPSLDQQGSRLHHVRRGVIVKGNETGG